MKPNFDEYVTSVLSSAGWDEKRHVETAHSIEVLRNAGFVPTKQVENFLSSFGGICFTPPVNPEGAYRPGEFSIDLTDPICDFELVSYWSKEYGEMFCPVGAESRRATVVIGESERFYLVADIGIHLAGESLVECMNCLVGAYTRPSVVLLAPGEE
jgi:hypothetical protein